jgi:hypothetical protein
MAKATKASLERRVAALEAEVARLKECLEQAEIPKGNGWKKIVGSFANDPSYDEAMRLGREWRESFGVKPRKTRKKANGNSRQRSSQPAGANK